MSFAFLFNVWSKSIKTEKLILILEFKIWGKYVHNRAAYMIN